MINFDFDGSKKKTVLLRGPVLTQSGYGVHARQIARWLLSKDIDVKVQALPWGDTPWHIDRHALGGLIGEIMDRTVDPSGQHYDATFQLQLPNEWDTSFSSTNVGISAVVETDICHPSWVAACNRMSHVVVPSKHAEMTLRRSGEITVPVSVVPESYNPAVVDPKPTKVTELSFSTPFNFLIVGQLTGNNPENDRKNIFYTIKWFCEAFSGDKKVGLVIKTNLGRATPIDRMLVRQTMAGIIREARKGEFPRIHMIHGDLSDEEMASLYVHPQIKALLTLTRGEGYGLPILEAAASGLPVIATGWSGHMDFMSHGRFIDVGYKISEVHPSRVDGNIFIPGSKWAQPIESDFKRKIEKFRDASDIPTQWAKQLREKLLPLYSQEKIQEAYDETLGHTL
jgi:glycosyltransferase involved in cell wall biosynthesis